MNYVYAVICHKITNPLIFTVHHLLKSNKSIVLLHIDKKTNQMEREKIYSNLGKHSNLYYIKEQESIDVQWGNFSQIEVMLLLMNKALDFEFKYFSLISGDDIPILPNIKREIYFENSYKKSIEFIGININNDASDRLGINYPNFFFKKDHSFFGKMKRKLFLFFAKKMKRKNLSHLPTLYKGSTWFTLTDKTIKYIFNYVNTNPNYLKSFKTSLCGDEVFFQTIVFNNPDLKTKIYGLDLNLPDCEMGGRYIDWITGPDFPKTLDESDFNRAYKSQLLFSRKFKENIPLSTLEENMKKYSINNY
ncbi:MULTISPECIES: beta-1,6-N-acetylglucosaminyltransferase [unclassified Acinetobacter]|uniref:beta-1,6-N-acetylglucosaminyltransferase n=1 Tax=unclassified Acinetobacter TaxID=196816 RepID=UPI00293525DA|nr:MULTISPECIES: beta-1,6-N-acetylglucosaminyltransferase [unclassified Acinetobacter]WOE30905.1 beta-1,6-N-acetylglucosaminyltransferase [Acinetobacter sp. SAAs470]WOE39100.1 beta-1,6-N-acetylglucosaminyltransferase [Acinetobacter sp. SAAs474]